MAINKEKFKIKLIFLISFLSILLAGIGGYYIGKSDSWLNNQILMGIIALGFSLLMVSLMRYIYFGKVSEKSKKDKEVQ